MDSDNRPVGAKVTNSMRATAPPTLPVIPVIAYKRTLHRPKRWTKRTFSRSRSEALFRAEKQTCLISAWNVRYGWRSDLPTMTMASLGEPQMVEISRDGKHDRQASAFRSASGPDSRRRGTALPGGGSGIVFLDVTLPKDPA